MGFSLCHLELSIKPLQVQNSPGAIKGLLTLLSAVVSSHSKSLWLFKYESSSGKVEAAVNLVTGVRGGQAPAEGGTLSTL